jgi:hypothetical protein
MKKIFLNEIERLPYIVEEGTQFSYIMGIIRAILQYCSYSAIEYLYSSSSHSLEDVGLEVVKQLLSPSDGSFVNVLDRLLPEIRNNLEFCLLGFPFREN